jgi:hypothetical protein
MNDEASLIRVYVASGQLEAQVVKSKLESFGIPVLLKYESAGVVFGITLDGLGEVKVLVPAAQADEARELLSSQEGDDEQALGGHPDPE